MAETQDDLTVTQSFTVKDGPNGSLFAQITPSANRAVVNGRTGVGTLNPQNALDVNGAAVIGQAYAGQTVALANSLIVQGSVGVGTAVPTANLHVVSAPTAGDATALLGQATSTGNSDASAVEATATINGNGSAFGLNATTQGGGNGLKIAVLGSAIGSGLKYGASFSASNAVTDNADTYGVYASSYSGSGTGYAYGMLSYASGDGSGTKTGLYTSVSGGNGAKYGGTFFASTSSAASSSVTRALYGYAYTAGTGTVYGCDLDVSGYTSASKYGIDVSANHYGSDWAYVAAVNATASFNASGNAVAYSGSSTGSNNGYTYGISTSASSSGSGGGYVYGASISGYNTGGTGGVYGLVSYAGGSSTGPKYGLYSYAYGSGTLYAAYFSGRVHVAGLLTKTSGTFLIDHPLDPYNRLLRHNFVESPEELCMYRGKVKLDAAGQATVTMPGYFVSLTKEDEATVTISPIGRKPFLTSYEWNAKFDAFTAFGEPNAQVSYLVLATRDDPAIHVLRQPVEEDKTGDEKGKLLFPDAYPDPAAPKKSPDGIRDPVILGEVTRFKAQRTQRDAEKKEQQTGVQETLRTQEQRVKQVADARDALVTRQVKHAADLKASIPKPTPLPGTTPKGGKTK